MLLFIKNIQLSDGTVEKLIKYFYKQVSVKNSMQPSSKKNSEEFLVYSGICFCLHAIFKLHILKQLTLTGHVIALKVGQTI